MKKTVLTLLMIFALGSWSLAQTQTQSTDSNKSSSANGMVSGPTVNASDHSATIRWKTDDRAATIVKYGTDKNNLDKQTRHSGGARDHNVTLAELQPGTKYFYQIQKESGEVRAEGEFTTKGSGSSASSGGGTSSVGTGGGQDNGKSEDRVVITEGPVVQPGADGNAKVVWKTDDIAATDLRYGTDQNNLQQRAYKPGGSREHEADLKNLQAGQTYYFQILRRDGSVRTAGQFQYQPQTVAAAPAAGPTGSAAQTGPVQIVSGPTLNTVGDSSAVVTWVTNMPSSSGVRYGTDRNNMYQGAYGSWGTNHSVTIQGLKPSTNYFFQVESTQSPGVQAPGQSQVAGFQTVAPGAQAQKNPPIVH